MTLDELGLSARAHAAAEALLAAHPQVVFTSGRRDLAGQAHAMASNVVHNRDWIEQTYVATPQRNALQACIDNCGADADQTDFAAALLDTMNDWTDPDLSRWHAQFA